MGIKYEMPRVQIPSYRTEGANREGQPTKEGIRMLSRIDIGTHRGKATELANRVHDKIQNTSVSNFGREHAPPF